MLAVKNLSAYGRVLDKINGKEERKRERKERDRCDPAEKESAGAISPARRRYRGYVQISR